jgi:hypothetical protein
MDSDRHLYVCLKCDKGFGFGENMQGVYVIIIFLHLKMPKLNAITQFLNNVKNCIYKFVRAPHDPIYKT